MATWKRLLTEDDLGSVGTGNDTNFANTDLQISQARNHILDRQPFIISQGGGSDTDDILRLEGPNGNGTALSVELRGEVSVKADASQNAVLRIHNAGGNYTEIKTANSQSSDVTLTLPAGAPANGRYLYHTSGGQLTWATVNPGDSANIGNSDFTIDTPTVRNIFGTGTLNFEIANFQTENLRCKKHGPGSLATQSGRIILEGEDGPSASSTTNVVLAAALAPDEVGSIGYGFAKPYNGGQRAPMMFCPFDVTGEVDVKVAGGTQGSFTPLSNDDLPDYGAIATAAGFGSIPEYLADADTPTPCFMVNDAINPDARKLTLEDVSVHLLFQLINENIANGIGDEGTYTSGGTGNPGLAADLNGDGSVSTADLLEFLTAFGQIDEDVEAGAGNYTIRTISIRDAAETDLSDGTIAAPNKLQFQFGDVTINNGSLDIAINAGDDEITIQDETFFQLSALPGKKLKFLNDNGNGNPGITVKPASSGGTITLFAKIKLMDNNNNIVNGALGSIGYAPISVFDNSDPLPANGEVKMYIGGTTASSSYTVTSAWANDNLGSYLSNTNIDKIQFSFFLEASDVVINSASIDGIKTRLTPS